MTRTISYNKPRTTTPPDRPSSAPPPPRTPSAAPKPHRAAADLLTGLRALDSRLLLSERDVHRLAPEVSIWLERGVTATVVQRALSAELPSDPIKHPAAFLSHRLTTLLPPPLPPAGPAPEVAAGPAPFQTCDGCERAFRAPEPGRCRDCRTTEPKVA